MRRAQDTEQQEQYEALVLKLESGARESSAFRQLLIAEEQAAIPVQTETQLKGD